MKAEQWFRSGGWGGVGSGERGRAAAYIHNTTQGCRSDECDTLLGGEKKGKKRNTGQQLFIFLGFQLAHLRRALRPVYRPPASALPRLFIALQNLLPFTSSASSPFFNHPPGMLLLLCVAVVVLAEGSSGRRQIFSGWR